MPIELSPSQSLFVWRLIVEPNGAFVAEITPEITAFQRSQLQAAGLIAIEKRKAGPKSRARNFVSLTEQGWNWAERNLSAKLPARSTAGVLVLAKFLACLKLRIEAGDFSLAQLLSPRSATAAAISSVAGASRLPLRLRLFEACRRISGESLYGTRIRLAALRAELSDVPGSELDSALQDLERNQEAAIYPLDDPREIRPEDEAAALASSSGTRRHVLYLSRPEIASSL
jgi:hypothetical protein